MCVCVTRCYSTWISPCYTSRSGPFFVSRISQIVLRASLDFALSLFNKMLQYLWGYFEKTPAGRGRGSFKNQCYVIISVVTTFERCFEKCFSLEHLVVYLRPHCTSKRTYFYLSYYQAVFKLFQR